MSSNECPDVYTNWTGGPLKEYINAGFAQPVTDLVSEMGLDSVVMPSGLEQGTVDGEIYALPILNIAIEGFYYNKDMFEQVGITEEPSTISELEAACDKLVEAGITPLPGKPVQVDRVSVFYGTGYPLWRSGTFR